MIKRWAELVHFDSHLAAAAADLGAAAAAVVAVSVLCMYCALFKICLHYSMCM